MLSKNALDFLKELSKNNNREWFHANKKRYEADLKKPFEAFIGQLIESFNRIDPSIEIQPKEAIFRIYRDTRFSKDKTPYKTHVGAIISKYGRKGKEYPDIIHMNDGAVATSGDYENFYDREKRFHHIINPKTGLSPEQTSSVSVRGSNTMDADALATAVLVMEPDQGIGFIDSLPAYECLILKKDGSQLKSKGWRSAAK